MNLKIIKEIGKQSNDCMMIVSPAKKIIWLNDLARKSGYKQGKWTGSHKDLEKGFKKPVTGQISYYPFEENVLVVFPHVDFSLFDHLYEGVVVAHGEDVIYSNRIARHMFGFQQLKKMHQLKSRIHRDYCTKCFLYLGNFLKGKTVKQSFEFPTQHSEMWLEMSCSTLKYLGSVALMLKFSNITRRKNSENILWESFYKYHALFNQSHEGIALVDFNTGNIIDCNPEFQRITGMDYTKLKTKRIWNVFDHRNYKKEQILRALRNNSLTNLLIEKSDGSKVPVRSGSKVLTVHGQKMLQYLVVDVEEVNLALESLKKSEQKFRMMFDYSHDLLSITDLHGNPLLANPAWHKTLGYSEESIGNPWEKIHPYDLPRVRAAFRSLKSLSTVKNIRYRFLTSKRSYVHLETTLRKFRLGKKTLLYIIAHDITERERYKLNLEASRIKYSTLVKTSPDAIVVTDTKGTILEVSNKTVELLNAEHENDLIGRKLSEFLITVNKPGKRSSGTVIYKTVDQKRVIQSNMSEIRDGNGKVTAVYSVCRDITEDENARSALLESFDKYHALFYHSAAGIVLLDMNECIVECNEAFLEMTGSQFARLKGKNIKRIIANFNKKTLEFETSLKRNGQTIPVKVNSRKIKVLDRELIQCIISDISDHKALIKARDETETELRSIQKSLEESISLLTSTMHSTADGVLVVDIRGKVTFCNVQFYKLWRIPAKLQKEKNDKKLLSFVLSQLSDPKGFLSKVNYLYKHTSESSFDVIHFKDGRIFERYSQPQKINNTIIGRVWSFRDVTDMKKAEKSIRENEMRYKYISELISDYAYSYLINGEKIKLDWLVGPFKKITGYSTDKIASGWGRIVFAGDLPIAKAHLNSLINGNANTAEYRVLTRKGKVRWMRDYAYTIKEDNVSRIFGAVQDITDYKLAELRLQESEQKYRIIVKNITDALVIHDFNGRIINVNKIACTLCGCKPSDLIGKRLSKVAPNYKTQWMQELKKTGSSFFESDLLHSDGHTVPVIVSSTMVTKNQVQTFIKDISKLKKAEYELKNAKEFSDKLIETAPSLIMGLDDKGKIVLFNKEAETITGYKKINVIGKSWTDLFEKGNKSSQSGFFEGLVTTKSGSKRMILWSKNLVHNDKGNVKLVLVIGQDVTDRNRYETELEKLNNQMKERVNELERFERLTVGRELKMIELKARIRELESKKNIS